MFQSCINVTSAIDLSKWVFSSTSNILFKSVFSGCSKIPSIDTTGWVTTKFTSLYGCFSACTLLTSITGIDSWDTTNVTDMAVLFRGCLGFSTIDVSNWNVSKVTSFGLGYNITGGMFYNCKNLTTLDLSGWILNSTSNINFSEVFMGCEKLTTIGDISGWVTTKITNLATAFTSCYVLDSNFYSYVIDWDTSNVTDFRSCFQGNINMPSIDFFRLGC